MNILDNLKSVGTTVLIGGVAAVGLYFVFNSLEKSKENSSTSPPPQNNLSNLTNQVLNQTKNYTPPLNGTKRASSNKKKCATIKV